MIDIIFQFTYSLHKRKTNIQKYNKLLPKSFITGENKTLDFIHKAKRNIIKMRTNPNTFYRRELIIVFIIILRLCPLHTCTISKGLILLSSTSISCTGRNEAALYILNMFLDIEVVRIVNGFTLYGQMKPP